jgi:phytoene dehydrogenase-like protein
MDACVVGSGPNGLAAAIALARAGRRVVVYEGAEEAGGGVRSRALTRPGFVHDVCSAIHPFAVGSPFFRSLQLERYGLEWIWSPSVLAHAMDDGPVLMERTIAETGRSLGVDAEAWRRLMGPCVRDLPVIVDELLGPPRIPRHPLAAASFGWRALLPSTLAARAFFRGPRAAALFAGIAAHANVPLELPMTSSIGLVLGALGHAVGWPFPRGGAQRLTEALVACLRAHGGEIVLGRPVRRLSDLPEHRVALLDVTPRQLLGMADVPDGPWRRGVERFDYGMAVFKLDYALDGPVPWAHADYARAATVHLGGTLEEVAASERAVGEGRVSGRPYVLLAQHTLFDPSRAPEGKHTLWAYCHVPKGFSGSMTDAVEEQIERFAPGFRSRIIERSTLGPVEMEALNPNHIGGSIDGGASIPSQMVTRPTVSFRPYHTPLPGVFLCSSSTPPGPGVHGLCGYYAARAAMG